MKPIGIDLRDESRATRYEHWSGESRTFEPFLHTPEKVTMLGIEPTHGILYNVGYEC